MLRIGHGFDIHIFGCSGPITLGGVCIPFHKGILAHSDGDVVLHAIIDALLGAAALGDIGTLFPDTHPTFKDINSRELLHYTWEYVQRKCYYLCNIDVTILAQEPRILPFAKQMRTNISEDLKCHIDNINIKATTTEGLGVIGKNSGIACEALVLLKKEKST